MSGIAAADIAAPSQLSVMQPELAGAFAACADIVRERARNFYYGLRLTPEPKRSAIYAVYAWMRAADDQVDEAGSLEEKRTRLEEFRQTTERMIRGEHLGHHQDDPAWIAFRHTVQSYDISAAELRHMIDGQARDIEIEAAQAGHIERPDPMMATRDELRAYCDCVASSVGRVCVRIWGLRSGANWTQALELAGQRGLAFQLTNILRDYAEDYDEGRVYLPAVDFSRHAQTPANLRRWNPEGPSRAMVSDIAAWARKCYDTSAPLDDLIDPACLPALWAMTRIYSGLLSIIEKDPQRIVGARRIRLSSAHKAAIALRAAFMARASG